MFSEAMDAGPSGSIPQNAPDDRGPEYTGPYDALTNGACANGHPVNQYGRCAEFNQEPPTCG